MNTHIRIDQAIRYKPLISYIKEYSPKQILEIGSGPQGIGCLLDIPFDGLDVSLPHNEEQPRNMNFIQGSALNIPREDNTYDLVFSCDMLEHIDQNERIKVFEESLRVCKKGGTVIFSFPCGFWGKICDYFLLYLFKFFHLLYKKVPVPSRLTEHIERGYPTKRAIERFSKILENSQQYNLNNCFSHLLVVFCDMIIPISRLSLSERIQTIKGKIINKYLSSTISSKSIIPYRKYIIIHKE